MSEMNDTAPARRAERSVDAARRACRRMLPDTYRCACGRVRDRCVRASVQALWSPGRVTPARPAQP